MKLMTPIITASRQNGAASRTEVWHVPHELEPDKPLCNVDLAGKFKRSKGRTNCVGCRQLCNVGNIDSRLHGILLTLDAGVPIPVRSDWGRYPSHDDLYDRDLVANVRGKMVLTSRGRVVVQDLKDPVGWLDQNGKIFHARNPLYDITRCGIRIINDWSFVDALIELNAQVKKLGRRTTTCIPCIVAKAVHAGVD